MVKRKSQGANDDNNGKISSYDNSIQKASLNDAQGSKHLENSQSYKEINNVPGNLNMVTEESQRKNSSMMKNESKQEVNQQPQKGMSTINLIQK